MAVIHDQMKAARTKQRTTAILKAVRGQGPGLSKAPGMYSEHRGMQKERIAGHKRRQSLSGRVSGKTVKMAKALAHAARNGVHAGFMAGTGKAAHRTPNSYLTVKGAERYATRQVLHSSGLMRGGQLKRKSK